MTDYDKAMEARAVEHGKAVNPGCKYPLGSGSALVRSSAKSWLAGAAWAWDVENTKNNIRSLKRYIGKCEQASAHFSIERAQALAEGKLARAEAKLRELMGEPTTTPTEKEK